MKKYQNSESALSALETQMIIREFKRKKDWVGLANYLDVKVKEQEEDETRELNDHLSSLDEVVRKNLLARVREQTNTPDQTA